VNWELETGSMIYCCIVSGYNSGVVIVRFLWDVTESRVLRRVILLHFQCQPVLKMYVTRSVLAGNVALSMFNI
jgi:hypothetical protein